ncbi:D-glycero-beta-D-manno-heptose 1-phosphate adenylyltransferase [Pedobacter soli]|uniref:D-glycero-beta-D-manno-heptose 1-phosphate adenylyltransferase n=1 Tax=Pedobacter soli TaxID=390242 RepID=A0A1G6UEH9_9SPHI|nr:D-glycero-beta-D-manno-heptose 1-phosphate adenylyltransferase [Pedobacter soli]SDD39669.1 D-beta-D-heptose 7-phosphate kinase / D-beta-D-heptose 1-phosphate adenosyltransferase [Pedobacter soli]
METLNELQAEKVLSGDQLTSKLATWKAQGLKLVFTNGCFDLLHIGHLSYLLKAASFGDKLIIGLNADSSVKRLKGESRPINKADSRALMLASLFFVDAVVVFEEDTPLNLITTVMPDVLVKGGDYLVENIVGAKEVIDNGGVVNIVDFINGYSSTSLIQKISGR